MDKRNKVPGCDRLTRPEEIDELKKYLKEVKDVQEEYVESELNNLEAPGITTGLFPNVNGLPETIVELDTPLNNPELETRVEKLESKNVSELYDSEYAVPDNLGKNVDELYDSEYAVPDNTNENVENLEDKVIGLEDKQNNKLENKTIELDGEFKELGLESFIDELDDKTNVKLETSVESLNSPLNNPELETRVEKLESKNVSELYDSEYAVPDNLGKNVDELYDSEYAIPDNTNENVVKNLEDKVENLRNYENKAKLRSDIEKLIKNENPTPFNEKSLSNYEKIFKVLDDIEAREGAEEYINKLRSLITAYLVNDSLKPGQAQQYLEKLRGCFIEYNDNAFTLVEPNNSGEARNDGLQVYIDNNDEPENIKGKFNTRKIKEKLAPNNSEEARDDKKYHRDNLEKDHIEKLNPVQKGPETIEEFNKTRSKINNPKSNETEARETNNVDTNGGYDFINNSKDYSNTIPEEAKEQFEKHKNLEKLAPVNSEEARDDENYRIDNLEKDHIEKRPGHNFGASESVDIDRKVEITFTKAEIKEISKKLGKHGDTPIVDGTERIKGEYDFINTSKDYSNTIPEEAKKQFEKHKNLEKLAPVNSEEARETNNVDINGGYDFIDNNGNGLGTKVDSFFASSSSFQNKFKQHTVDKKENLISVNSGEARETDTEYDYVDNVNDDENKIKNHIGANNTKDIKDKKIDDGIYLRPDYELPFLELFDGNFMSMDRVSMGNTLSSLRVNDGGITNINSYIRQAAELVGSIAKGSGDKFGLREMLVNETLHILIELRGELERRTNANRERLPGKNELGILSDAIQGGTDAVVNKLAKSAINAISARPETNLPLNRPSIDKHGRIDTTPTTAANSRVEWTDKRPQEKELFSNFGRNFVSSFWSGSGEGFVDNYTDFKANYLLGNGIYTTLMDLCKGANPNSINTIEDLKNILKGSPYITTPTKFGTVTEGLYRTTTLDTNSNWEIILEPLCDKTMNGGFSYLPAIQEINTENYYKHGVVTHYNKWIPFTNFSLQKSRLTSKTLGLFDGEISYPVSAELTNELRLTLVDDQYKSWRHYFQKCMDVSVYNSEAHDAGYYNTGKSKTVIGATYENDLSIEKKEEWEYGYNDDLDYIDVDDYMSDFIKNDYRHYYRTYRTYNKERINTTYNYYIPTAVDKSNICIAFYKNITFRIRIYVMTPQFSTIRKFDLLCVLKDFMEEYEGDIDAPGADLQLTFSIVGELNNDEYKDVPRIDFNKIITNTTQDREIISSHLEENILDLDNNDLNIIA